MTKFFISFAALPAAPPAFPAASANSLGTFTAFVHESAPPRSENNWFNAFSSVTIASTAALIAGVRAVMMGATAAPMEFFR